MRVSDSDAGIEEIPVEASPAPAEALARSADAGLAGLRSCRRTRLLFTPLSRPRRRAKISTSPWLSCRGGASPEMTASHAKPLADFMHASRNLRRAFRRARKARSELRARPGRATVPVLAVAPA